MNYLPKGDPGTTIVAVPSTTALSFPGAGTNGLTRHMVAEVMHEQCRTIIAKGAMENIAALSALEQHLYSVAPLGEERYKTIVDCYAISAAIRVGRW